ncbi:MAG: LmeA family phospholipid-binding protein [Fimbriimonadales bacterium]
MPLFTDPQLSQRGRLARLVLSLRDFVIRDLPVVELSCDLPNNRFALGLLREGKVCLTKSGEGKGSVTIDEDGLERYILARFPAAQKIEVRFDKYKLFAKGTAMIALIRRDFEIICDLGISEKRKLVIANPITFIEGKRIRDGSDGALLRAFNPVLDLDRDLGLHGAFDMESILIKDGRATITGAARIPVRP